MRRVNVRSTYSFRSALNEADILTQVALVRPNISELPTCRIIFEKLMLIPLQLNTNTNLLYNKQFGLARGRSTTDVSVELVSHVFNIREESRDALSILNSYGYVCV